MGSTIVVNSTADVENNSDGLCTLREAIGAANDNVASGATAGECAAGSGSDIVDLTGVTGTITLTFGLPFISSDMTINGPGANQLTIQRSTADGTPRFRIFTILHLPQPPTVNISGLTITNGYSLDGINGSDGGGVSASLDTTVNLTNMVIRGNTTGNGNPGSGGSGGGVFNFGTMTITGSTISGNTTGNGGSDPGAFGGYGGGVFNTGTLTLTNTTVSGNTTGNSASSTQGGYGGGIYSTIGRTVTFLNCTISDNHTGLGGLGGGINNGGTANIKDTIVANNLISGSGSGPDLSGSFTSQDFNLIEDASGASVTGVTTHNIIGVDPLLGPLAANGGSTLTHALLFGSPAIDAANSSLTTDQRGQPRPIDDINTANAVGGNATDIGAFEGHSYEVNSNADTSDGQCTGVATGNGCTLREAIAAANSQPGAELITFASPLTAGGSAEIELLNALPTLISDMFIIGPGASQLTIRRSTAGGTPDFRIFTISSGTVTISGLTVTNGKTPDGNPGNSGSNGENGGGVLNAGSLTLTDVNLTGNRTGAGGAGLNTGGFGGAGGAIANYGSVTMTNCNVTGNIAGNGGAGNNSVGDGGRGGAIYSENDLTMTNCSVSGNASGDAGTTAGVGGRGGDGGGIYSRVAVLTLTNVTVNNNVTGSVPVANGGNNGFGGSGGGISITLGTATLTNCTISGNQTGTTASGGTTGYGGAINNDCPMTISNSTISNNTGNAGAILSRDPLVITNSTLSGNHSAGISNDGTATLTLTNCTITAHDGFGVINSATGSSASVRNTIIAGNGATGSADINGSFNSQGHNLIGVNGSGFLGPSGFTGGVNGDKVGTSANPLNARLAPLSNNGGPTQTHALLPGSPALDAGDNCVFEATCSPALAFPLTTDQRGTGFSRRADSADADIVETVDIGAFEAHASIPDFADNSLPEDTPLALGFSVGDQASITNITATSSNTTLVPNVPANLSVTGSGAIRTLNITPAANQFGTSTITVTVVSGSESMSDTFVLTVTAVPDTPSITPATTNEDAQTASGLVISRNAADGPEVTHFWIRNITNGTLFKHDGITQINNSDVITFAEGNAGLKFTPAVNLFSPATTRFSFDVQGSTDGIAGVVSPTAAMGTITVTPIADTPTVTPATTTLNSQSTSGLVITRNAVDDSEVTHFKISNITNGTLFKNNGTSQINNNDFITFAEGNAGLKFTPASKLSSPSSNFSFQVQGATSSTGNGLSPAATATITVNCGPTVVTNTNDSGPGSLRTILSNACPGSTITFNIPTGDPGFNGGAYTITLTSGELVIDRDLTIAGLGTNLLTIRRSSAGGTPNFRIFNVAGATTVIISGLTIMNGSVTGAPGGGAVLNSGALTLTNCAVVGNTSAVAGGGIENNAANGLATMTISGCLIAGNVASSFGSGIFNEGFQTGTARLDILNSTITGNNQTSFGGGIYNDGNAGVAVINLTNSTLSGNRSGSSGGGLYNFGHGGTATINLNNTIVSDNTGPNAANGPDIFNFNGNISGNNNLIQTTSGSGYTINGSNNLNGDPMLEKDGAGNLIVKNNGGPTSTLLLLPVSPAINAGSNTIANNAALTTDQRGSGFSRFVNATVDIGALEANYSITATSGSGQSTIINSAFATQLQATVQESGINQNGLPVTFTAPASGASGTFPGSVIMAIANTNSLGVVTAPTLTANGIAGSYNVTASLAVGVPSALFPLTNTKNPTTVSLVSSLNPSEFGQSVTFTATVASSGGAPTGTVQFKDGATILGSPQALNGSGVAQLTASTLTTGTHAIMADYGGDANFLSSTGTLSGGQAVNAQFQLLLDSSGPDANQAAAFDSLLFVRDPFHVQTIASWINPGPDRNTRVLIFAANLQLNPGETASAVVVNLIGADSQSYDVAAEDVRAVPNSSLVQIMFRLPDDLAQGTCQVAIKAHGQTSNTGSIRVSP